MSGITVTIRVAALPAWERLQNALRGAGPVPCTVDPDSWTSDDAEVRAWAACHCAPCPALEACAAFAEANGERVDVWGGVDRATAGSQSDRRAPIAIVAKSTRDICRSRGSSE